MSQISPPIRILGLCAIGLIAAWFVFLTPGDPAPVPAATTPAAATPNIAAGGAPATTGPGAVAEAANELKANSGAKTADPAATAAAPAATGAGATAAGQASPALTGGKVDKATARSGMPAPVLKAIADRKVMVLYFWNPKAADDRAVDAELRKVVKQRKKVLVHRATVAGIARYGQITRGVDVKQSPTLVVVDRKLQAEALVGFTDRGMIEQAIDDATRVKK